jgi:hypothetical protein
MLVARSDESLSHIILYCNQHTMPGMSSHDNARQGKSCRSRVCLKCNSCHRRYSSRTQYSASLVEKNPVSSPLFCTRTRLILFSRCCSYTPIVMMTGTYIDRPEASPMLCNVGSRSRSCCFMRGAGEIQALAMDTLDTGPDRTI